MEEEMSRKGFTISLAIAFGAVAMLIVSSVALATHPRPKGASPLYASMVPAQQACATPNRTHGPPLVFASCNPPVATSQSLTIGSPDANGAAANGIGFVRLTVKVGIPGPPEDSDVLIVSSGTDIRCLTGTAACGNANTFDGPDYTGELQGNAQIQITDHWNALAPGGGPDAATVIPIGFPVPGQCASTADTAIGGTCSANTSANATVPGAVKDGKRAIVEISQLQIADGGDDGLNATAPNTLFAVQGIFIP
jgi:hypothetical protein